MRRKGFTLIELLVVVGIIAVLIAVLVPALHTARQKARDVACASRMRQIYAAFVAYLDDHNDVAFWRGYDINLVGMDWYVFGGRETDNKYQGVQGNLFNMYVPRPLNAYVSRSIDLFRCPDDTAPLSDTEGYLHFEYFGNDYIFNCYGLDYAAGQRSGGFAGVRFGSGQYPSATMVFQENTFRKDTGWHDGQGNLLLADGHRVFVGSVEGYRWDP